MKAVCWMGSKSIEVHQVPDPQIINPRDAIVRRCTETQELQTNARPVQHPGRAAKSHEVVANRK